MYWRLMEFYSYSPTLAEAKRPFLQSEERGPLNPTPGCHLHTDAVIPGGSISKTSKGHFEFSPQEPLSGDKVYVLLGCPLPAIFRKGLFGCAYVRGLMDREIVLGPLPEGSKVVRDHDEGVPRQMFVNSKTQETSLQDPRLGTLPDEWEPTVIQHRLWPTKEADAFRNNNNGEILYSDPRLLLDAVRARGVCVDKSH
jgi:hypothetical protein